MRRLDFLHPEFNYGLNVTVRLGTKWANLLPGDKVELAETNGPIKTTGTIEGIMVTRFDRLPPSVFEFEHASSAHTPEGLYKGMREAYGDAFRYDSIVTVIEFTPLSV